MSKGKCVIQYNIYTCCNINGRRRSPSSLVVKLADHLRHRTGVADRLAIAWVQAKNIILDSFSCPSPPAARSRNDSMTDCGVRKGFKWLGRGFWMWQHSSMQPAG
jgi:hypothetical protein